MTEQLAFDQRSGKRGTVYIDQRLIATSAQLVDLAGHQPFTGSGFAQNKDRCVCRRHMIHRLEHIAGTMALTEPI
jgi:hypothetical protein